jgi:hypothetical protein
MFRGTLALAFAALAVRAAETTPAAYLKSLPAPHFAAGHALAPLTRYGWSLPFDTRVELAERWGYCLEFGGYVTEKSVAKLDDPESVESKIVALTASDPAKYPLFVICNRELPADPPPGTWCRDADGQLLDGKAQSLDGTVWHAGMKTIHSPEAPDSYWQQAGKLRADPIARIREKCPIAIVLNGGEYGLGVIGFGQKVWEKDPAVVEAKGERGWFDYISERKAHQELLVADAVRAVVPDRLLYVYYPTSGGTHRSRYGGWDRWYWDYTRMQVVSDLPSSESYYRHFNSGYTGDQDQLTMVLNARGFEIAQGKPLSYNWLCAGWPRKDPETDLSPIDRYMGFLKCFYTAGMVGGNAGYYAYPKDRFKGPFPQDEPPHWLQQMVACGRVHALFSHLEDFLRNGDLLPGPNKHRWSKGQPAYELPTGAPNARVVARKHHNRAEWLVTAWAADGPEREVKVTIPELGEITLLARPAGSVYRITKDAARLVDENGMLPTARFAE